MEADPMLLQVFPDALTVCQIASPADLRENTDFYFLSKTDEELSLVCRTGDTPTNAIRREDGWRGFRIAGQLDFSLVGILARITTLLADAGIGLFAVSTYNTDYILVKAENLEQSLMLLREAGYQIE
jgi:hypothetical protein